MFGRKTKKIRELTQRIAELELANKAFRRYVTEDHSAIEEIRDWTRGERRARESSN